MADYLAIARSALFATPKDPSKTEAEASRIAMAVRDLADAGRCAQLPPVSDTRTAETIQRAAIGILNERGARQFILDGAFVIGLWAAEDTPEVRHAIALLHPEGVRVIHLEDAPAKYRKYKPAHLEIEAASVPRHPAPGNEEQSQQALWCKERYF